MNDLIRKLLDDECLTLAPATSNQLLDHMVDSGLDPEDFRCSKTTVDGERMIEIWAA
jgi:hypothetical protein